MSTHLQTHNSKSMHTLRSKSVSWLPDIGYVYNKSIPNLPGSYLEYRLGSKFNDKTIDLSRGGQKVPMSPEIGKGMFTYVPDNILFSGLKLPQWGSNFGSLQDRDASVSRDMIGKFILIRVKRYESAADREQCQSYDSLERTEDLLTQLKIEYYNNVYEFPDRNQNDFRYEWMFGFIRSYNSYTAQHEIVLQLEDIPITGIRVNLEKCTFQEWTRTDIDHYLGLIKKEEDERKAFWKQLWHKEKIEAATYIQKIWRGCMCRDKFDNYKSKQLIYKMYPNTWIKFKDPKTQESYYYNTITMETRWEIPKSTTSNNTSKVLKDKDTFKRHPRFIKPKPSNGKKRSWFNSCYKGIRTLPGRNPKHHPAESPDVKAQLGCTDLPDSDDECNPIESSYDRIQWQRKRAKNRYWNNCAKHSIDWKLGNEEACRYRASRKWNTTPKDGNNINGSKGRRGNTAQKIKTQQRRDKRRQIRKETLKW